MQHVMLDIETLGTRPGFVVMSAALVRFSDYQATSVNLSVPEQQALGLEIDPQTHQWWGTQDPAAWNAAIANPLSLPVGLGHLHAWCEWAREGGEMMLWCHGASFDAPVLGEVYRRAGLPTPWSFRDIRDTRTLYDLAGVNPHDFNHGTSHVAVDDAIAQTKAANEALKRLTVARGLAVAA